MHPTLAVRLQLVIHHGSSEQVFVDAKVDGNICFDGRGNTQLALFSSTFPLPSQGHQQFKLGIEGRNISGDLDPQFPTHTNCANRDPGEGVKEEI